MSIHSYGQTGLIIGQRTHVPLTVKVRETRSLEERIAAAHERRAVKSPIVLRDPAPVVALEVKPTPKPAPRPPRSPQAALDIPALIAEYQAGESMLTLQRRHHIGYGRLRRVITAAGVPIRPPSEAGPLGAARSLTRPAKGEAA